MTIYRRAAIFGLNALAIAGVAACGDATGSGQVEPLSLPLSEKIVFESFRSDSLADLFVIDQDGSNVRRLTDSTTRDRCPVVSPDGNWIVFHQLSRSAVISGPYSGNLDSVVLMRADGTDRKPIAQQERYQYYGFFCPQWSAASDRILVAGSTVESRIRTIMSFRLRVMDRSGNVLGISRLGTLRSMALSPAGDKIAAGVSDVSLGPPIDYHVVVMNIDGTSRIELGKGLSPAWHPSGDRIAWVCGGVCVASPDGSNRKMIYPGTPVTGAGLGPTSAGPPDFSPDGLRLAFPCRSGVGNFRAICVMELSSNLTREMPLNANVGRILWTRDGKALIFECALPDEDLCSVSAEFLQFRNLTASPGRDGSPTVR